MINYSKFIQEGLLYSLKQIMRYVQKNGIKHPNSLYLKIDMANSFNQVPGFLKEKYPEIMEIVLENNNYNDLEVFEDYFSVVLIFDNKEYVLKIFFNMVHSIEDMEENFFLQFMVEKEAANIIYLTDYIKN